MRIFPWAAQLDEPPANENVRHGAPVDDDRLRVGEARDRRLNPAPGARLDAEVIDVAGGTVLRAPDEVAGRRAVGADAGRAADRDDRDTVALDADRARDARRDRDAARARGGGEVDRELAGADTGGGP